MRAKGICYDTGFIRNGGYSRESFDPDLVRKELTVIRDDLHCTAVHITGGDPDRLDLAARLAAELGLEIWFSPYPLELTTDEILTLLVDCAERAERLRSQGAEVVFVTGAELSVMNHGFLEGDSTEERISWLLGDPARRPERFAVVSTRLNAFLRDAVALVRERFHGKVTYAAIQFEAVDWDLFDFTTFELIRSAEVADRFRDAVRSLVAQPKPVAITGFGTATWRGAGDVAPRSMEILETDETTGAPLRLNGEYERDEAGQAAYLSELLEIFDTEGVDSAFVFLFALYSLPHRPDGDPRDDLDLASLGIVKVLEDRNGDTYPDLPWEPKAAFAAVADHYRGG
uniref:Abortive infection protein n=1 Tax=Streptomyces sp. NBC_00008 TaxID=2903610 RepID=A0AAU2W106_9ACTN